MGEYERFRLEIIGDVAVVHLKDPALHDMILIAELHDELLAYIQSCQPHKLLVDFAPVTLCSSAVINSLLLSRRRLMDYGGVMRLCAMNRQVRGAFVTLRLDGTLFHIDESLPESLAALASAVDRDTAPG